MSKKLLLLALLPSIVWSAPLGDYSFKSPAFNGSGYSSHVLTIENQEATREKARADAIQAALDRAKADAANTNINKFLNNLESRVYAQISQNVATAMFANGSCTTTGTGTCSGTFVMNYQMNSDGTYKLDTNGNKIPATSISWAKTTDPNTFNDAIALTVTQPGGANPTVIYVPLSSFQMPGQ